MSVNLLMIAHIIQWRLMGKTVSPIEPSESMATLQRGALNAGFIFFSLALLATLIFGRFVCGWGCHVLALQDGCAWLLKKCGITPKPFRSRLLIYAPLLAALYMFVWPTAYRLFVRPENEPLIPAFSNHLVATDFWETFPSVGVAIPFLFICGFATVWFLGQKGFCTYACPYGGFFAVLDKVSPLRIRVTDACHQCGQCTANCTSNVLVHSEVRQYGAVVDPGCMKCLDCISVCPMDALYLGFGKPLLTAKPHALAKRNASLTWPEEIVGALIFLGSLLAVRGAYGLVPFLMALGCAAVVTYLALKTWRILRAETAVFHRFVLKAGGELKPAGWSFLAVAAAVIGLTTHTGWIRYHETSGERAFGKLQIADELALAQPNPGAWVSPTEAVAVAEGGRHLALAERFGLFQNGDGLAKLAWFDYLSGETDEATRLLRRAAEQQHGKARALSLYYRGAILNRLGRPEEALAELDRALSEREDLLLAREEKGEALWRLGRPQEAIAAWRSALRDNPRLPLSNNFLAGALQSLGQSAEATAFETQADQFTPPIPAFHWMLGTRLQRAGLVSLGEKHLQRAAR